MNSYICPQCGSIVGVNVSSFKDYFLSFDYGDSIIRNNLMNNKPEECLSLRFYRCPKCNNVSSDVLGVGMDVKDKRVLINPESDAKKYPSYIPEPILKDYFEAYSILHLSPKASATLSRRCLQGMIRNYWSISKSRLVDEVNELESRVPVMQWKAIDSLRKIGNIGAHMEKDVNLIIDIDVNEAKTLISLIELLMEQWYIANHNAEELYSEIIKIDCAKEEIKNGK